MHRPVCCCGRGRRLFRCTLCGQSATRPVTAGGAGTALQQLHDRYQGSGPHHPGTGFSRRKSGTRRRRLRRRWPTGRRDGYAAAVAARGADAAAAGANWTAGEGGPGGIRTGGGDGHGGSGGGGGGGGGDGGDPLLGRQRRRPRQPTATATAVVVGILPAGAAAAATAARRRGRRPRGGGGGDSRGARPLRRATKRMDPWRRFRPLCTRLARPARGVVSQPCGWPHDLKVN